MHNNSNQTSALHIASYTISFIKQIKVTNFLSFPAQVMGIHQKRDQRKKMKERKRNQLSLMQFKM